MQCNVSAMFHFVAVSVQQKIEHIFLVWGGRGGYVFIFYKKIVYQILPSASNFEPLCTLFKIAHYPICSLQLEFLIFHEPKQIVNGG